MSWPLVAMRVLLTLFSLPCMCSFYLPQWVSLSLYFASFVSYSRYWWPFVFSLIIKKFQFLLLPLIPPPVKAGDRRPWVGFHGNIFCVKVYFFLSNIVFFSFTNGLLFFFFCFFKACFITSFSFEVIKKKAINPLRDGIQHRYINFQ